MADRNFNIPMGPDRTGEIDLQPIDFGDGSTAEGATLRSYFSDSVDAEGAGQYQPTTPIDVVADEASSVEPMGEGDFVDAEGELESDAASSERATSQA